MLVSALMTLSGVRSSCDAYAVNSSWRRRDCSTGDSALSPMIRDPANMAASSTGAASASPSSSTFSRWTCSARFWPATTIAPPRRTASRRKVLAPILALSGRPLANARAPRRGGRVAQRHLALSGSNKPQQHGRAYVIIVVVILRVGTELRGVTGVDVSEPLCQPHVDLRDQAPGDVVVQDDDARPVGRGNEERGGQGHPSGRDHPRRHCRGRDPHDGTIR